MATELRLLETRDQALRRLAAQARERGIRVYQYPYTGEFYASSYRQPDMLHRVTRLSCDCAGFCWYGRCQHHAALLHYLGELPPVLTPRRLRIVPPAAGIDTSA